MMLLMDIPAIKTIIASEETNCDVNRGADKVNLIQNAAPVWNNLPGNENKDKSSLIYRHQASYNTGWPKKTSDCVSRFNNCSCD